MSRKPGLERSGAIYKVMNREDRCEAGEGFGVAAERRWSESGVLARRRKRRQLKTMMKTHHYSFSPDTLLIKPEIPVKYPQKIITP
jgi:hypothetical protein